MYFLLEKQKEVAFLRTCEEKEVDIHFFRRRKFVDVWSKSRKIHCV